MGGPMSEYVNTTEPNAGPKGDTADLWLRIEALSGIDCTGDYWLQLRVRVLVIIGFIAFFCGTPVPIYVALTGIEEGFGRIIMIAAVVIYSSPLILLRLTKSVGMVSWILLLASGVPFIAGMIMRGGLDAPMVSLLFLTPVAAGFLVGVRGAVIMTVFYGLCFVAVSVAGELNLFSYNYPYTEQQAFVIEMVISVLVLIDTCIITVCFLAASEDARIRLENARAAAEQAGQAKAAFLATMSHEIRTPLNGLLGMSGLLSRSELTDKQREQLDIIEESGHALRAVIDDILDITRLDAEMTELEKIDVDPVQAVQSAYKVIKSKIDEKGLLFSHESNSNIGLYTADPTRIRQILINLIGNAAKFTDHGSIRVVISEVSHAGRQGLHFEVIDTGIGISEEKTASVFEPFTQADSSTTRQYGGTGLGLSICKRLVTLMNGEIGVRRNPDGGCCFWFFVAADRLPTSTEIEFSERSAAG